MSFISLMLMLLILFTIEQSFAFQADTRPTILQASVDRSIPGQNWEEWNDLVKNNSELLQQLNSLEFELDKRRKKIYLATEGGADSGGGSSILLNNHRYFLDQFVCGEISSYRKGVVLEKTNSLKKINLDRLDVNKLIPYQRARTQIEKWMVTSPFLSQKILNSLSTLYFYITNRNFRYPDFNIYMPQPSQENQITTELVGLYTKNFGVMISFNIFNELDLYGQTAFFIHESLRQLQIFDQFHFDNKWLQETTCRFMRDPHEGETLDDILSLDVALRLNFISSILYKNYLDGYKYLYKVFSSRNNLFKKMENPQEEDLWNFRKITIDLSTQCLFKREDVSLAICQFFEEHKALMQSLGEIEPYVIENKHFSSLQDLKFASIELAKYAQGLDRIFNCLNNNFCFEGKYKKEIEELVQIFKELDIFQND